jgi:putative transposase
MDGKGRWIDNLFFERLWGTLKYEEIHLKGYENVAGAIRGICDCFDPYHEQRPHQALARLTPYEVYAGGFTLPEAAR